MGVAFDKGDKADLSNRSAKPMDDQEDGISAIQEMTLDKNTAHSICPVHQPNCSDEDILRGGRIELQSLTPGVFVKFLTGTSVYLRWSVTYNFVM